ncbi:hypothetical protein DE146DRAFT_658227 [Phaeosphaeria sp. MPI-PUGE-AT-0046c]|nr:hypothetical protein DE146DRAFT_658227 [Phaeosphaeria sp. MPI-PUGE-AT-0046c]
MSTTPKNKILLLGAGELGTSFVHSLAHLPTHHLTLAIRSPAKYSSLASTYPSLTLLELDLSAPSSTLVSIFANYDVIISATGFMQTPDTLVKLCHEVLAAGKLRSSKQEKTGEGDGNRRLWFFPWQWGVDYDITLDGQGLMPLFGAQKHIRDILRAEAQASDVTWTVVGTGIFMSFLFEEFWGIVDRDTASNELGERGEVTVRALRDWSHKVTVTDVRDIGRVLARIVSGAVDATDKVVYIAGQTVSYGELADIVKKVSGKEVKREAWSIEYLEGELAKDPENDLKKYRLVFAREGVWWDEKKTVNRTLGMEMMRVEEYARKTLEK